MGSLMGNPEIPQNYWKWRTSVFSELLLKIGQEDQTLSLRFLGFDNFKIVANSKRVFYSIFEHFGGATNWDMLLTEGYYSIFELFWGATNGDVILLATL